MAQRVCWKWSALPHAPAIILGTVAALIDLAFIRMALHNMLLQPCLITWTFGPSWDALSKHIPFDFWIGSADH